MIEKLAQYGLYHPQTIPQSTLREAIVIQAVNTLRGQLKRAEHAGVSRSVFLSFIENELKELKNAV